MSFLVNREQDMEAAERVRAWIAEQTVSGLHPTDVVGYRAEDSAGDEAWFFDVRLPVPDPQGGSWDVEALNTFVRAVRDKALDESLSWPWYIGFLPETEEDQEDEDRLQLRDDA